MEITIPLWAFILLCIAALPVALIIAMLVVLALIFIICIIIVMFLDLFKLNNDYEEPIKINKATLIDENDPDYNPEYIPPEERK